MYIVKETPIIKNKKLYRVGDLFPYSDKDSHLLWNLEKQETVPYETTEIVVSETVKDIESPKIAKSKAKKN